MKFSVIVPVHNSERYLYECLESLRTQTFCDFEALIIDDYSKDKTLEIVNEFLKADSRFLLFQDKNGSYGHKINVGIEQAKGVYVCILESDDSYVQDALASFAAIVNFFAPDYVDGFYRSFWMLGQKSYGQEILKYNLEQYDALITGDRVKKSVEYVDPSIWTGAYKRQFLLDKKIRFNESSGASFQDISFAFLVHANASSAYHIRTLIYNYRTDNQNSSSYDKTKVFAVQKEYEFLRGQLEKRGLWSSPIVQSLYFTWKYHNYMWNLERLDEAGEKEFANVICDEYRQDYCLLRTLKCELKPGVSELVSNCQQYLLDLKKNKELRLEEKSKSDKIEIFFQNGVVLFGCGSYGRNFYNSLDDRRKKDVLCFCDNDESKQGSFVFGLFVFSLRDVIKRYPNCNFVICNKNNSLEIKNQLIDWGILKNRILFSPDFFGDWSD